MDKYISIPYEDYKALAQDSVDKANVISLLQTEFPDDTCQLIAIKAILGLVEDDTTDPSDPITP